MQEQGNVFRKVAVDRLSSPDELTEMVSITRPLDWLILCVMGALLLGAIGWSSVATLPVVTEGAGLLQRSGTTQLSARQQGQITHIWQNNGALVEAGTPLVEIGPAPGIYPGAATLPAGERRASEVLLAPFRGHVVKLQAKLGDPVAAGSPVMTVEPERGQLQAVIFVSEKAARQIRPGLPVQLTPEGFPPQQFGFVPGTVARVEPSRVSDNGLRHFLDRRELAELCIAQQLRIRVDVVLSSNRGNSVGGPAEEMHQQLAGGMKVKAEITLGEEHPIGWVLPWLQATGKR